MISLYLRGGRQVWNVKRSERNNRVHAYFINDLCR